MGLRDVSHGVGLRAVELTAICLRAFRASAQVASKASPLRSKDRAKRNRDNEACSLLSCTAG